MSKRGPYTIRHFFGKEGCKTCVYEVTFTRSDEGVGSLAITVTSCDGTYGASQALEMIASDINCSGSLELLGIEGAKTTVSAVIRLAGQAKGKTADEIAAKTKEAFDQVDRVGKAMGLLPEDAPKSSPTDIATSFLHNLGIVETAKDELIDDSNNGIDGDFNDDEV